MREYEQAWGFRFKHERWLADFKAAEGRPPRILGIGNIANNAFKNAIALRERGIECDVLCYSYFHIMGCPEWEQADFDPTGLDDFKPKWSSVDLNGYQRPKWFAQGNLGTCLDYLIATRESDPAADGLWLKLEEERDSREGGVGTNIFSSPLPEGAERYYARRLRNLYGRTFSRRRDQLTEQDVSTYSWVILDINRIRRLFLQYDAIIGYATDGIFPLLCDFSNYISYEHGTIRTIPFTRTSQGRLCALTYACARDVLVTNCDNICAVDRLALPNYRFVPHAILEDWSETDTGSRIRKDLLDETQSDFIVFHPSRHHWGTERDLNFEKGNDILIEGFAKFVNQNRPGALLLLVEWGQKVEESRNLIEALGIVNRVKWIRPQPVRKVLAYVAASDVLADQFVIGAWGAIMPIGLWMKTPSLIYIDEKLHEWCFPEMPPVLNARKPAEIQQQLIRMINPQERESIALHGRKWYDKYHSMSVVAGRLVDSLMTVLDDEFSQTPAQGFPQLSAEIAGHIEDISLTMIPLHKIARLNNIMRLLQLFDLWFGRGKRVFRPFLGAIRNVKQHIGWK
jgi:glycosyltransferase involved in cell wall biosynthesis